MSTNYPDSEDSFGSYFSKSPDEIVGDLLLDFGRNPADPRFLQFRRQLVSALQDAQRTGTTVLNEIREALEVTS